MIYFDYAATSWPKPAACFRAMEQFLAEIGSNPAYSLHKQARLGDDLIENARINVGKILGVNNAENIVFKLNATEAINLILWGFLERGDRVLASHFEHASVTRPLAVIKKRRNIKVSRIGDPETGIIRPEHIEEAAAEHNIDLLVINHASNVTGAIQPIEKLTKTAHEHGIAVLVDTCQTAGIYPLKAEKWGVDFLAFSGHKHLLGPMGTGGFYVADTARLNPIIVGSTGYFDNCDSIPDTMPHRYEPGSPNAPGIVGLGASCKAIDEKGVDTIRKEQQALTRRTLKAFDNIPGLRIYGSGDARKRVGVIGFNIEGKHPGEVGDFLDMQFDIMVRTGLCSCHWANELTGTMPDGLVRASMGYFTKEEDVDLLIEAVTMVAEEHSE